MLKLLATALAIVALTACAASALTTSRAPSTHRPAFEAQAANAPTTSFALPSTELHFSETPIHDRAGRGPLLAAPAYGDMTRGEHGTFIRMPAGFDGAPHIHTHDFWVAVISGVAVNNAVGGPETPLPPGSFWFQPGGQPHITKCISQVECVFFASQNGPFDYIPVNP